MNKILNKLNSVPGVVGSMICSADGQVLAHLFPPEFDESMLKAAASILEDNTAAFHQSTGGVKMFDFRFAKARIIIKVADDSYFVLYCSNQVVLNLNFLEMTISVASKHFEKTSSSTQEVKAVAPAVQAPTGPKPSASELMEKGPLSSSLTGMQAALAKFLGPMAKIIFVECVEKWLESNQPSRETLPQLVSIISAEIDDQAKIAQYGQMIAQYL